MFEGAGHGDFVGVLDVRAGRNSGGDARDAKAGFCAAEFVGEVGSGRFALRRGAGSKDDLFGSVEAGEQVGDAKLFRAYAADGGEGSVQDVIEAGEGAGFLDGGDVGGLFDDAEGGVGAMGAGAEGAGVDVGNVVAEGAEAEVGFELLDGVGEGFGLFGGAAEDVEGEALRSAGAHAGKLAELLDEAGHGFCEASGRHGLGEAWKIEGAEHVGGLGLHGGVGLLAGLVDGGGDEVFEEFEVGATYKHWPGKTVTEYDDHLFCLITMNHHPLHLDSHYAEGTQQGRNVVVGNYVYSLLLGMSVSDVSGKAIANLEVESLRHVKPVFHGDTIYGESTVLDKKESSSKNDRGIVTVETIGYNQDGVVVCIYRRKVMVPKRPQTDSPEAALAAEQPNRPVPQER